MGLANDPKELQHLVGATEQLTDEVLQTIIENGPSREMLPVLNLLLLERHEAAVQLIRSVLDSLNDIEYVKSLQNSRFYLQRMSVPRLSSGLPPADRRAILLKSLGDDILAVVRAAVDSIAEDSPFDDDELLEIAGALCAKQFVSWQMLAVDILAVRAADGAYLLEKLLRTDAWRVRLRIAVLMDRFSRDDRALITERLVGDRIEFVRLQVAQRLCSLEHSCLRQDPSSQVRVAYLANVIDQITDPEELRAIACDPSWEVRRAVFGLKGNLFKQIAVPLITEENGTLSWRRSYEILELVETKIGDSDISESLADYLFSRLRDRVADVRSKAAVVLCKIIDVHTWSSRLAESIEAVVSSSNYLHRIAAVPVAISYDRAFHTRLCDALINDSVVNVRDYYRYCCIGLAAYEEAPVVESSVRAKTALQ
ncbi:serine/threonine-protein phosphatase 2A regulatory subunit A [Pancytospora philotis]|nr:serine/threonine-protein phosphatase 2A regulatory subunit A [Pancytospora philotis]